MKATYRLAIAAGRDAANRQMLAEGRTQWNAADWNLAAEVFARLMGEAP